MADNKEIEINVTADYNELLQQAVAVLPWGHTAELISNKKTKDNDDAILYNAFETVSKGWSLDILVNDINLCMCEQSCILAETGNNFATTLPVLLPQRKRGYQEQE